ncbi:hypothetical protein Psi01_36890 [Planobispora siamensis]|uniref:Uncharacterized protein n=1 Tax=Planobispora siamensis TaxID=936338 RepID=A0A8J3SGT5_9ACTN|nr:hypothetical protein Psi01_36890 [Planobispora siamensis]
MTRISGGFWPSLGGTAGRSVPTEGGPGRPVSAGGGEAVPVLVDGVGTPELAEAVGVPVLTEGAGSLTLADGVGVPVLAEGVGVPVLAEAVGEPVAVAVGGGAVLTLTVGVGLPGGGGIVPVTVGVGLPGGGIVPVTVGVGLPGGGDGGRLLMEGPGTPALRDAVGRAEGRTGSSVMSPMVIFGAEGSTGLFSGFADSFFVFSGAAFVFSGAGLVAVVRRAGGGAGFVVFFGGSGTACLGGPAVFLGGADDCFGGAAVFLVGAGFPLGLPGTKAVRTPPTAGRAVQPESPGSTARPSVVTVRQTRPVPPGAAAVSLSSPVPAAFSSPEAVTVSSSSEAGSSSPGIVIVLPSSEPVRESGASVFCEDWEVRAPAPAFRT